MMNKGVSGRASGQITVIVNEKEVDQQVRSVHMSVWRAAFNPSGDTSGTYF